MADPVKTKKHRGMPKAGILEKKEGEAGNITSSHPPPLPAPLATASQRRNVLKLYGDAYPTSDLDELMNAVPYSVVDEILSRSASPLTVVASLRRLGVAEAVIDHDPSLWSILMQRDMVKPLRQATRFHEDYVLLEDVPDIYMERLKNNLAWMFPSMRRTLENRIAQGFVGRQTYSNFWRCAALNYLQEAFLYIMEGSVTNQTVTIGSRHVDGDELEIYLMRPASAGERPTFAVRAFAMSRPLGPESPNISEYRYTVPPQFPLESAIAGDANFERWIELVTAFILHSHAPWRCGLTIPLAIGDETNDEKNILSCSLSTAFEALPVAGLDEMVENQLPDFISAFGFPTEAYLRHRKRLREEMEREEQTEKK